MESFRTIINANLITPIINLPWKSKNMQVEVIVIPLNEAKSVANPNINPKITDLKGLGKEIWKNVNIEDYIKKEREAWD